MANKRKKLLKNNKVRVPKKQLELLLSAAINTGLSNLHVLQKVLGMLTVKHGYGHEELQVIAGMYTLALEEFGKVQYLKSIKPGRKVEYTIVRDKKYEDHDFKFARVMQCKELPNRCKKIHTKFVWAGITPGPVKIKHTMADVATRMRIFYSNVYDNGEPVKFPQVGKITIRYAVRDLTNAFMDPKLCPTKLQ